MIVVNLFRVRPPPVVVSRSSDDDAMRIQGVDFVDSVAGFLSGHLTGNDQTIPKSLFFQSHLFLFGNVPVKCTEKIGQPIFLKSTKSTLIGRIPFQFAISSYGFRIFVTLLRTAVLLHITSTLKKLLDAFIFSLRTYFILLTYDTGVLCLQEPSLKLRLFF